MNNNKLKITITYCVPCDYSDHALNAAKAIMKNFQHDLESLTLVTGSKGVFDIQVDGELLFSKSESGRFPENDELVKLMIENLS